MFYLKLLGFAFGWFFFFESGELVPGFLALLQF